MANQTPEYFITPNWDIPPNGPIALGSVITSLKKPQRRLVLCTPSDDDVLPSSKYSVSISRETLKSREFSVLKTFLSGLLGLGVDVGVKWTNADEKAFEFDRIDTTQFIPTEEYIRCCVESLQVRRFLETCNYRKPVYIITGIKVVSGAQGATATSRNVEGILGAQVDGTILSGGTVPVDSETEYKMGRTSRSSVSWDGSTDFVLAYKVSEVRIHKSGEVKREQEYLKGALLEHGLEQTAPEHLAIDSIRVAYVDASMEFEKVDIREGDVNVVYAFPLSNEDGV